MAARRFILVLATMVMPSWSVLGNEPPSAAVPAPPVEDLVARALERSPTLEALKTRYFAALRTVRPAGALADPMIEFGFRSEGRPWDPMRPGSMAEVSVTQVLPYPGKRQSRREASRTSALVAEAEAREWQQRLIALVRTLYARIHALDGEQEILAASSDLLDLLQATTASRYAAGHADQEALLKVQMERLGVRERLTDLLAEREDLTASLLALLDEPSAYTLGPVTALPEVTLPERGLEEDAIAYCCIVAVARARLDAARRRLEAARLETRPNFLVGVGAGSTLVPEPVLTVRFGIEVPFWASEKQDPQIEEALLEVRAAEAELREKEALVRSELRSALARFRRAEELILVYREGIVPQTSLALQAALASYRAGTGDFSTVVEDYRRLLEARIALTRLESDRFIAWAALQELVTPIPAIEEGSR